MKRLYLYLFLLLFGLNTSAQVTISGRVLDDDTGEGLPFCNVYFTGTTIGVSSDLDGYYQIETNTPGDSITASAIGYENRTKHYNGQSAITINFRLRSADFKLQEVVVIAGENPANRIVKGIIANKEENRLTNQDAFHCQSYTKVELDLDNLTPELMEKKLFKPFAFVFENIDSTSDEKPFLPAYITESVDQVYYNKSDGQVRSIPEAMRASGVTNSTLVDFIENMQADFSIYDNWINIVDKPLVSPFSNQGLFYYEYYILDSTHIEGQWSYKLKFKPKRKQENTFYGDFWVVDTSFAVQRVNMRMSPDVNINLISRVIIYSENEYYPEQGWIPVKQKTVIDFTATEKTVGVIGRKSVSYSDYDFSPKMDLNPDNQEPQHPDELLKDDSYWEAARHDSLSKNEAAIYAMIDSIKNVPMYKTYVDVLYTLVTGYKQIGKIEIGPYFNVYNNNLVENHHFQLGMRTSESFSERVRLGGYIAYGTRDKEWKYGGEFKYLVNKYPRTLVGASYDDGVSFGSESSEDIGEGNLFSGIYRRPVIQKIIRAREAKVWYEKQLTKSITGKLTFLHRFNDPFGEYTSDGRGFNFYYTPDTGSPQEVDTTTFNSEVLIKLRYAFEERKIEGGFFSTSLGSRHPIIELQYRTAVKGVLGADYTYQRIGLSFRHWVNVKPIGWLSYRMEAGKIFGKVPFLLAEVHPGNETYFYGNFVFNTMNRFEFASDAWVAVNLVHHFDGFFLNKFPLLRKLKWRTVASFRGVYGTMTEENKLANQRNLFDPELRDTYNGFRSPSPKPFMETSIGIENILKILRVDAVWRLNYNDNPDASKFSLRAGLGFYF